MSRSVGMDTILEKIKAERKAGEQEEADDDFVHVESSTLWEDVFGELLRSEVGDDLAFYVFHDHVGKRSFDPFEVFRRSSPSQPAIGDTKINWEETVYLNLLLQQYTYSLVVAICERNSTTKKLTVR